MTTTRGEATMTRSEQIEAMKARHAKRYVRTPEQHAERAARLRALDARRRERMLDEAAAAADRGAR